MKKVISGLFIVLLGVGAFVYYNITKNIESRVNLVTQNISTQQKSLQITGKSSVNLFTGTLYIPEVYIKNEAETVKGDLLISGINYWDKNFVLKDQFTISLKDLKIDKGGISYVSDTSIKLKSKTADVIELYVDSKTHEKDNKSNLFNQEIKLEIANALNLYKDLNELVSNKVNHLEKDESAINKRVISTFFSSYLKETTITINNNKLLQKSAYSDIRKFQPSLTDEQAYVINEEIIKDKVRSLPEAYQGYALDFFNKDKSNFEITIVNKSNITFKQLVAQFIMQGQPLSKLIDDNFESKAVITH